MQAERVEVLKAVAKLFGALHEQWQTNGVNDMEKQFRMPKNKNELYGIISNAFIAGCTWGYGVDHGHDMGEQEQLGVDQYIGKITCEEAHAKMLEIWNIE